MPPVPDCLLLELDEPELEPDERDDPDRRLGCCCRHSCGFDGWYRGLLPWLPPECEPDELLPDPCEPDCRLRLELSLCLFELELALCLLL